jgi:plastocyanin
MRAIRNALAGGLLLALATAVVVEAHGSAGSRPAKAPPTKTVKIVASGSSFKFSLSNVTVKVGTRVIWKNTTGTDHTVTSDKEGTFNLDPVFAGKTRSYLFKKTGTYKYHCSIHPFMRAKVIVTK